MKELFEKIDSLPMPDQINVILAIVAGAAIICAWLYLLREAILTWYRWIAEKEYSEPFNKQHHDDSTKR